MGRNLLEEFGNVPFQCLGQYSGSTKKTIITTYSENIVRDIGTVKAVE
jgi:hypothetical protein